MSERPWLSCIVPCKGENLAGLARLLDSLSGQGAHADGVEVMVVVDTHRAADEIDDWKERIQRVRPVVEDPARPLVAQLCGMDGGGHWWGHPQRQEGMRHARGAWLWFMADDDIATPNALKDIRACIDRQEHPRPLFFRFVAPWRGEPVWHEPRQLVQGNIDASGIVVPNVPDKLGEWGNRYCGDYDFAYSTAEKWGGDYEWCNHVVCWARPDEREDWTQNLRASGLRVNIGCGHFLMPGWTNLDANPEIDAELHATVPPLPFGDGTCAELYAGHVLEHLRPEDGAELLRECYRVLEPGGTLGVTVPDTRAIMGRWLGADPTTTVGENGEVFRLADLDDVCHYFLFSTYQDSPHAWAYDAATLRRALEAAGFRITGEIDRERDPRLGTGQWFQVGIDCIKPKEGDDDA